MNTKVKELLNNYEGNENLMYIQFNKNYFKGDFQISIVVDKILEQSVDVETKHFPLSEYKQIYNDVCNWLQQRYTKLGIGSKKGCTLIYNMRVWDRFVCNMEHMNIQ
jgi:hypothetical protein